MLSFCFYIRQIQISDADNDFLFLHSPHFSTVALNPCTHSSLALPSLLVRQPPASAASAFDTDIASPFSLGNIAGHEARVLAPCGSCLLPSEALPQA